MATRSQRQNVAYGFSDPLLTVSPQPIVSDRSPTQNDFADVGTIWVNQITNTAYILIKVAAGVATWATQTALWGNAQLVTNDGNAHALFTAALVPSSSVTITANLVGNKADFSAVIGCWITATFRRAAAGGAVLMGSSIVNLNDSVTGVPTFAAAANGNNAQILVTGEAGIVYHWSADINVNDGF